jgi:GAF domain-containing protein
MARAGAVWRVMSDDGEEDRASDSYGGGDHVGNELANRLSELARNLQGQDDVEDTLAAIVAGVVDAVEGAQHASISAVRKRREVVTRAATDDLPRAVDRVQYETGEGPCLDTLYEQRTARLPDLSDEARWPEFTRRTRELGILSMLAVQLYVKGEDLGALNIMSEQREAFSEESEQIALLFASHAAVAMAGAQEIAGLRTALDNRDLIGQAKGILMERFKITSDRAFQLLMRVSQDRNRKLWEIAEDLVRSGEVPAAGRH